ncbi:MAG: hypothetical protein AABW91_01015 [Nanoarchaeota archaeon]
MVRHYDQEAAEIFNREVNGSLDIRTDIPQILENDFVVLLHAGGSITCENLPISEGFLHELIYCDVTFRTISKEHIRKGWRGYNF